MNSVSKVIVVGLDGFEPSIAEKLMAEGRLPNLATLRRQGGYARLRTTYPAQTPVAWSTFMTGTNPGGHGIFDFIGRDPETYRPQLALNRHVQTSPFLPPKAINMRRGKPVWDLLAEAGIPATVLRCPCTYPPEGTQARLLAGVGVPDLRGGLGTSTVYTQNAQVQANDSEKVVQLGGNGTGPHDTYLVGPINPGTGSDFTTPVTIEAAASRDRLFIRSKGQPSQLEVRLGQWSDWLKVKFKAGLLQSTSGMLRFYLVRLEPHLELYASPVNFDPAAPVFPISSPPEYARDLEDALGTYYTTGMVEDHNGLIHDRFDEEAFLEQCNLALSERRQMMRYELDRFDRGFLFCLFDTPDRLQHMFWRFEETDHPSNQAHDGPHMTGVIEAHYQTCDEVVGEAMERADDRTLLLVLSDHGMGSFRRGLNLNTWLLENGFLRLKHSVRPGPEAGDMLQSVDWNQTKAYALGLGGIYLNAKGREANGIVEPDEIIRVKTEIAGKLSSLVDQELGREAVRSVLGREQVYSGPFADESADLLVNFAAGYRASWDTPLGGIPQDLFEDNLKKWAGDHVIHPDLTPGVLFVNHPFDQANPDLVDLAPTIVAAFGVPATSIMEGSDLLS